MKKNICTALLLSAFGLFAADGQIALATLDATGGRVERPLTFKTGYALSKTGCKLSGDEIVCENPAGDPKVQNGWHWRIDLKQTNAAPFAVSAESLAEAPVTGTSRDYSIYLDIAFKDGGRLYGQISDFACEPKRGWQRKVVNVVPDKPVQFVNAYLLYRFRAGKVRFRNPKLITYPSASAAVFDTVCVDATSARLPSYPGYVIRDVAKGTGFMCAPVGETTLGVSVEDAVEVRAGGVAFHDVTLKDTTGGDRAVTLVYTIPLAGKAPITWWDDPRTSEKLGPASGQRRNTSAYRGGCGALSRWPFGAVCAPNGKAVGYDPDAPAFFRTGVHAGMRVLYIAFDVGFAPEHPTAHFRFVTFPFRAQDGFRGALAAYQDIFPEHHRVRLHDHGLWMAFHKISSVPGWEDFGFRIKEGDNEPAWDDAHGITTFHYTEPTSWWMRMKGDAGTYSFEDCLAEAKRQAEAGVPFAKAWSVSTYHDEEGRITGSVRDTPWCRGAVWNLCSLPGIRGGEYEFKLTGASWDKRYAGRLPPEGVDGEYIDSAEPYMAPPLDFTRAHFAAARTPLLFSPDTCKPGVAKCLSVYEYVRATADRVHAMDRYLMGNGIPYSWPWLVPFSDYGGQETKWLAGGEGAWSPMSDRDLLYRRAMSGGKPYCFLMNVNFDKFTDDMVDKYMQRSLAYGLFACFFSPNASSGHYFSRPELYNRHRPLFKKYVPVCKRISEAGWRPVNTIARSETRDVFVEQFGDRYLTVFNSGKKPAKARIRLTGKVPKFACELLSGEKWEFKGGVQVVEIPAETVRVLEFRPVPLTGEALIRARADGTLRGLVRQAETRDRKLGSVNLFTCVYNLLRAGKGLDKIDMLLDVAAELQDRNPESRSYGNFRWYARDGFVMDYNAVDFCMQAGSLIARDYRDKLTPRQRVKFDKLCELAIKGSISHRVRSSYTNIALMNAVNLVLLGEAYGRKDAFDAGVQRLDDFMLNTAICGICEYSSPTYTAVDLSCLHRLRQFARDPGVIDRAERLLRLFWSDVAASSFAGSGRLAGAHSRDYDYLFGLGGMATYLRAVGLAAPLADYAEMPPLPLELSTWRPDAAIRELAARTPRTIVSKWGEEPDKVRVQWTGRNVTLGISGANYWNMDIPLAVDFVSEKRIPRVYFIADGRRDPYGRKKIPEGTGPHQKTLHLRPFWGGAQRGRDALGLVMYRPADIPPETPTLESHIVFPCDVDEVFVNDERVPVTGDAAPFVRDLKPGDAVFVRLGAGACGVRVPWARDMRGGNARIALVRDGATDVRAFRLTVAHHDEWGLQVSDASAPGAAFWVRVMDDADTPAEFAAFRKEFRAAVSEAKVESSRTEIGVAGIEGRLSLTAAEPYFSLENVEPRQPDAVLAVDGRDIGLEILGKVPGLAEYRAELERVKREMKENRIYVQNMRPVRWEAEKGAVKFKMEVGKDRTASGGAYVWLPGEVGGRGSGSGSVSWQLEVKDAGTYRLWGRVYAPTPEDDSFFVSANAGSFVKTGTRGPTVLPRTDWYLVNAPGWKWCEFPCDVVLPKGPVVLTLHPREDGSKMDALVLTNDASFQPVD